MASSTAPANQVLIKTYCRRAKRGHTGSSSLQSNWRDWPSLTSGPAGLIADRVLSNDVADYIRFRAACSAWRRGSEDPRAHGGLDRRFHPRRWIMLPHTLAERDRRRFLNVSTGECIKVHLPVLVGHDVFGATSGGLLVLCNKRTRVVRLLNPLTRQLTDLPHVKSMLYPQISNTILLRTLENFRVLSAGLADDSTVALQSGNFRLSVAKPGDEHWTRFSTNIWISSALSFAGRFYCVIAKNILVLETRANQQPQLVVAAQLDSKVLFSTVYLVDNDGELILLHRSCPRYGYGLRGKYEAYRVDLDAGKTIPMRGLGGRAVFIGMNSSLSVSAGVPPSISADTVYICYDCDKQTGRPKIDACHLLDGSTEPNFNEEDGDCWTRRCTTIDYLSRYVCPSQNIAQPLRRSDRRPTPQRGGV